MIDEYGQLKGKTGKETAAAKEQPEENKGGSIEPEGKRPRVQEESLSRSTMYESMPPAT
jgi:hypothetical protein